MECITVLKHPKFCAVDEKYIVKSGQNLLTKSRKENKGGRRLCSRKRQCLILAGLLVATVLSYCSLLWLYMYVQGLNKQVLNQNRQLEHLAKKLSDLIHAEIEEVESQQGSLNNNKKDLNGNRNTRRASTSVPHFYLKGAGTTGQDGIFTWKFPDGRSFSGNDHFHAQRRANTNDLTEITITIPGMYFVFAKVLGNGRTNRDSNVTPPIGIVLMKRTTEGEEELDTSWTTQDDRGRYYLRRPSATPVDKSYPIDTLTVMGLYLLHTNDKIYVQKPGDSINDPNGERYVSGEQQAQFGAYLVEQSSSYR